MYHQIYSLNINSFILRSDYFNGLSVLSYMFCILCSLRIVFWSKRKKNWNWSTMLIICFFFLMACPISYEVTIPSCYYIYIIYFRLGWVKNSISRHFQWTSHESRNLIKHIKIIFSLILPLIHFILFINRA